MDTLTILLARQRVLLQVLWQVLALEPAEDSVEWPQGPHLLTTTTTTTTIATIFLPLRLLLQDGECVEGQMKRSMSTVMGIQTLVPEDRMEGGAAKQPRLVAHEGVVVVEAAVTASGGVEQALGERHPLLLLEGTVANRMLGSRFLHLAAFIALNQPQVLRRRLAATKQLPQQQLVPAQQVEQRRRRRRRQQQQQEPPRRPDRAALLQAPLAPSHLSTRTCVMFWACTQTAPVVVAVTRRPVTV